MPKKYLALFLCSFLLFPSIKVAAANNYSSKPISYKVNSMDEANQAISDALSKQSSKMILNLSKDMDYYDTYDLIIPYTRGLGTYETHNFGYAVNGGTWTRLEINVKYYTSFNEENVLEAALNDLVPTWDHGSDYDKIKAVHDYICENTVYSDRTAQEVPGYDYHSAYDALVLHESVCSGYALLFQKIMEKLGIPSFVYVDENEVAHAWNIVNLDGSWYQVDCTWDDKSEGYTYEFFLKGANMLGHYYSGAIELATSDYSK